MNDELCVICSKPDHGQRWRCESCLAEFSCPSAFLTMPTASSAITGHRTIPVAGLAFDSEGNGPWPMLGDEITCGPVEEVVGAEKTKIQRGVELARTQQRRSTLTVVQPDE